MLIRNVKHDDWQAVSAIEQANFSKEEAATPQAIEERTQLIPDTFLVAESENQIVGYIEGPVVTSPELTDELFQKVSKNPISGGYVAITSLSIDENYQKQGLGTALIAAMKDVVASSKRDGIILTCHDYLIPYYEMNDFKMRGLSESTHGGSVWYDMVWDYNLNKKPFIKNE